MKHHREVSTTSLLSHDRFVGDGHGPRRIDNPGLFQGKRRTMIIHLLDSPLVERAALYASAAHAAIGQTRKFVGTPYIEHPRAVAERISRVPGITPVAVAAAWLHDVIEDTEVTCDLLQEHFPAEVVALVLALTTPERIEGQSRRAHHAMVLNRLAVAPAAVQTIKCADILDNGSSLAERQGLAAKPYLEKKREQLMVMQAGCPELRCEALQAIEGALATLS